MSEHFNGQIEIWGELPASEKDKFLGLLENYFSGEDIEIQLKDAEQNGTYLLFEDSEACYGQFFELEDYLRVLPTMNFIRTSDSYYEYAAEVQVWQKGQGWAELLDNDKNQYLTYSYIESVLDAIKNVTLEDAPKFLACGNAHHEVIAKKALELGRVPTFEEVFRGFYRVPQPGKFTILEE